jgi:predicted RNase H-like nuclease (RuvC/YqgF family)
MSMKEFDKLEEKIVALVKSLKALKEENAKLHKELQGFQDNLSQKDVERSEIKKKISSLLSLVDSIAENGQRD